ncbi:MAG: hypothetical protein D6790_02745 [Caldilineae bacterium]|nr:MAG: hypothetical protein D6790_02745 [Caldilineae bacterium]
MYSAKIDFNRRVVKVYDHRGHCVLSRPFSRPVESAYVNGDQLTVQDETGRLYVYNLPSGSVAYTR